MKKKFSKKKQFFNPNEMDEIRPKGKSKNPKEKYRHNKFKYLEDLEEDVDFEWFNDEEE